jgi:sporulation-control protein spo0M
MRGSRPIYILRPPIIFPARELSFTLNSVVGGFLGMGTSEAQSQIHFEKNEYYLGESAKVKVSIDNSKCAKSVKGIKFKLHRHYVAKDNVGWKSVGSKYLSVKKEAGCASGEKIEKTFEIPIPT